MFILGGRNSSHAWQTVACTTAFALSLSTACMLNADAQSTFGSILGSVQDASGAVIPAAAIHIRNLDDNSTRDTAANASGEFQVLNLNPGKYAITATAPNFAAATLTDIMLEARQQLRNRYEAAGQRNAADHLR